MPICYYNNGMSARAVDADYISAQGEVTFPDWVSDADLLQAFPHYQIKKRKQEILNSIAEFERQYPFTPRRIRDIALSTEQVIEGLPFSQWVEDQLAPLRTELNTLA